MEKNRKTDIDLNGKGVKKIWTEQNFDAKQEEFILSFLDSVRLISSARNGFFGKVIFGDLKPLFHWGELEVDQILLPKKDLPTNQDSAFYLEFEQEETQFFLMLSQPGERLFSEDMKQGLRKLILLNFSSHFQKYSIEAQSPDLNLEKYWNLFNHLVQGVVYHDQSGQIIQANPAAERILGLTNQQILGKSSVDPSWKSIREDGSPFPGEEHPAMIALATGKEVRNVVMGIQSIQHQDTTWIVIDAIPEFFQNDGKPKQVLVSFSDITQIKVIKSEIREKKAILKSIMESSSEGIWAIDLQERLLYANTAFFDRFESIHKRKVVLGESILDQFEGEFLQSWRKNYQKVFNGESISLEERFDLEGKVIVLETIIQPIFLGKSIIGAAAFSKDVSHTARYIQTIESQNDRLREIAWTQSHVIRAPLARIMGLMNLIEFQEEMDFQELKGLLKLLRKSSEELDLVIREVVTKSEVVIIQTDQKSYDS